MKDFLECHLSEKYCFLQYVKKTRLLLKNHWQKKMRKFILFSSRSQMPYLIPGNFCNKKWSPKPDVKVPLGKKHVSLLDNAPNYLLVGCVIQKRFSYFHFQLLVNCKHQNHLSNLHPYGGDHEH